MDLIRLQGRKTRPVVIQTSEECRQLFLLHWGGKVSQSLNLLLDWRNPFLADLISKELEFVLTKDTLVKSKCQASLVQPLKEELQRLHVLLPGATEDQHVIQVAKDAWNTSEDIIKEALERLGTVLESHR